MPTITRFAPSPTGSLHLGGARTALFNFIYAKSVNGLFKIRIEDTDKSRNINDSINNITSNLEWLGIRSDDQVYYQSKNVKKHIEIANDLVNKGFAYKCYHTENELEELKKKNNRKIRSSWREKDKILKGNNKYCIRIKAPLNGKTSIVDKIQGKVEINNEELDDYVILRKDLTPTFLLSSAIDDFLMNITDIIRGDDHLTNSLRQKIIFDFLNYSPSFAHMSLIHNERNEKLSKRDNSQSIEDYKTKGFFPESIINYLLRMGWSYGDKEIFSIKEAIKFFKIENLGKSPSKIDEKKLFFLNNYYLKNKKDESLYSEINKLFQIRYKKNFSKIKEKTIFCISLFKERSNTLDELMNNLVFLIDSKKNYNEDEKKILNFSNSYKTIIIEELSNIKEWNESNLEKTIKELVEKLGLKFKEIAQPIRLLIVGKINGPSVSSILFILGKDEVIKRLKKVY